MANALLRATLESVEVVFNGDLKDPARDEDDEQKREKLQGRAGELRKRAAALEKEGKKAKAKKLRKRAEKKEDEAKKLGPDKDNTIIFTLDYPRSGETKLTFMKPLALPSGETVNLGDPTDFLKSGIFKEEVQGETILRVKITDKDRKNAVLKFMRTVFKGVVGVLTGDLVSGISNVVLNKAAGEFQSLITKAAGGKGGDATTTTVAESEDVKIHIERNGAISIPNAGSGDDADIRFEAGRLILKLESPDDFTEAKYKRPTSGAKPQRTTKTILKECDDNGTIVLRLVAEPL